jgi:hypothetical protein
MNAMIITLIGWIAANSNFAVVDPPRILLIPKHEMGELYYRASEENKFFQLQAFYNFTNATIYLPDTWRPTELYDQSMLLHELVHHLQAQNNVKVPCQVAFERQAYDLQVTWLREQGVENPYALMGTNALAIYVISACHDDAL